MTFGAILLMAALAADVDRAAVTFNKDVLPILQKNCQSCHRPGQVAPMSLLTYESARPWAKAIRDAVSSKKMPPWPADPRFGHFLNDRTLKQEDIDTLVAWANPGAPEGDAKDKPSPVEWHDGWAIPPDVVVSVPNPIAVPAKGVVELTDIVVPTGFKKDTWITSIEVRPSNPSVVHHVIASIEPHKDDVKYGVPRVPVTHRDADGATIEKIGKDDRLRRIMAIEAIYLPGVAPTDYRLHQAAKLIPAGSDLVIQMHYTPNGVATSDQTQVGFTIAKEPPSRRFITLNPTALRDAAHFRIPPGDPNWETHTELEFRHDAEIVWFLPHMHLRGKDMTYRLIRPGAMPETLLAVNWDFNWQFSYDAAGPIAAPKGSRLDVTAHFDNSANNKLNPNPTREVRWGDQTWEEMMVAWLGIVADRDVDPADVIGYPREFARGKVTRH